MALRVRAALSRRRAHREPWPTGGRVRRTAAGVAAVAATMGLVAFAPGVASARNATAENRFTQTNLVSDQAGVAQLQDPHLVNAWGIAALPNGPIWVSNNNGVDVPGGPNVSTVYSGGVNGSTVMGPLLDVTIPGGRVSTGDNSSPTGQVANTTQGFTVTSASGSGPAAFIFDSESGQISAWNPTADPIGAGGLSTATLESSSPTAVYKGLAEATGPNGPDLFAANFHDGTVDVFDSSFQPVTPSGGLFAFQDPTIPAGFAPFGIQADPSGSFLFVTYAKQDAAKATDVPGRGLGFIDVYTTSGVLVGRFAQGQELNAPWGVAFAPAGFGPFGGDVIVGNFGDGRINVFSPFGRFIDRLRSQNGKPLVIDGLWGLLPGNSTFGGVGSLIFSAGPDDESHGLLGTLTPAS